MTDHYDVIVLLLPLHFNRYIFILSLQLFFGRIEFLAVPNLLL